MQTIRSGGSQNAISELKSIMEIAADPEKVKAALQELELKIKEYQDAEKSNNDILEEANKALANLELKEKLFGEKNSSFLSAEKALQEKEARVNRFASELSSREQAFFKQERDFNSEVEAKVKRFSEIESQLSEKDEKANAALAKGASLEKEYAEKLSKLKSITG